MRRCELRSGDVVAGPARPPRRGERHRALIRVDALNGGQVKTGRPHFDELSAVPPHRRLPLGDAREPLLRAIDLLAPLGLGQRVLIRAQPGSGRTTLLRSLAEVLAAGKLNVVAMLPDERPDEVVEWRRRVPPLEVAAVTAEMKPGEQARSAELALAIAKRRAEVGERVVVLIDSLTRLSRGYRDPTRAARLLEAGRDLAGRGRGSLTVIATVVDDDPIDGVTDQTGGVVIRLDAGLAGRGLLPIVVGETRCNGEEELRRRGEAGAARKLRERLSQLEPAEAARELGERIASTKSNKKLLKRV